MSGNPLTDIKKDMIVEMYTEGKNLNDIANRLDISYSSALRVVQEKGLKEIGKREAQMDLSSIENKLDDLPDRIVKGLKKS